MNNQKRSYKSKTKAEKRKDDKLKWRQKMNLNMNLKAICSTFQMPKEFSYYLLNRTTSIETLTGLITMADKTLKFSLDTENDKRKKKPALIQIEFINNEHPIVILVELFHLPESGTCEFSLLISLFRIILSSQRTIQTWGTLKDELLQSVIYGLFQIEDINRPKKFNAQEKFKEWYNKKHPHTLACQANLSLDITYDNFISKNNHSSDKTNPGKINNNNYPRCICLERPYKFETDLWSLQLAIAYTTGEFLDKSHSISKWGLGLDSTLKNNMILNQKIQKSTELFLPQKYFKERQRLSKLTYAINDCFAVTKLADIIRQSNYHQCLPQYQLIELRHAIQSKTKNYQCQQLKENKKPQNQLEKKTYPVQHQDLKTIRMQLESIQNQLNNIELIENPEEQLRKLKSEQKQLHIMQQQYLQQQYQQLRKEWNQLNFQFLNFQQKKHAQYEVWKQEHKYERQRRFRQQQQQQQQ